MLVVTGREPSESHEIRKGWRFVVAAMLGMFVGLLPDACLSLYRSMDAHLRMVSSPR
jgi:hypothetical protein